MERLSDRAIEIIDELHTERLDYTSEYIPLIEAANALAEYENTGMEPEAVERMQDAFGRGLTLRTDAAKRLEIIKGIPTDCLRELVEADREGRCVVLPKDGMVYYIEEAGGERWIANKPIQQIIVKCGWGIATLDFSLFDTGKYFTREAAEAALKG